MTLEEESARLAPLCDTPEAASEDKFHDPIEFEPAVRADTILSALAAEDRTTFHIKNRLCINKNGEQYTSLHCSWPQCKCSVKIVWQDNIADCTVKTETSSRLASSFQVKNRHYHNPEKPLKRAKLAADQVNPIFPAYLP
jgi:hypothetical protein